MFCKQKHRSRIVAFKRRKYERNDFERVCNDLYRAELLTIVRAIGCKQGQNRDLKSQLFRLPALLSRRIGKSVLNSTVLLSIFVPERLLFRDYSKTKICSSLTRVEIISCLRVSFKMPSSRENLYAKSNFLPYCHQKYES